MNKIMALRLTYLQYLFLFTLENEPVQFYSLGRVGSGASDNELEELHNKISQFWERVYSNQMPSRIQWSKEKPDVWIKPESSVILQVPNTFWKYSNKTVNFGKDNFWSSFKLHSAVLENEFKHFEIFSLRNLVTK